MSRKIKTDKKLVFVAVIIIVILGILFYFKSSNNSTLGSINQLLAGVSQSASSQDSSSITITSVSLNNFGGYIKWSTKNVGNNWLGRVYLKDSQGVIIYDTGKILTSDTTKYNIQIPYLVGNYTIGVVFVSPNGLNKARAEKNGYISAPTLSMYVLPSYIYRGQSADVSWYAYNLPSTWKGSLTANGQLLKSGIDTWDSAYTFTSYNSGSYTLLLKFTDPTGQYSVSSTASVYVN